LRKMAENTGFCQMFCAAVGEFLKYYYQPSSGLSL